MHISDAGPRLAQFETQFRPAYVDCDTRPF